MFKTQISQMLQYIRDFVSPKGNIRFIMSYIKIFLSTIQAKKSSSSNSPLKDTEGISFKSKRTFSSCGLSPQEGNIIQTQRAKETIHLFIRLFRYQFNIMNLIVTKILILTNDENNGHLFLQFSCFQGIIS